MSLTPGTRLGVYDIIAAIGEGGMGAVFRARDGRFLINTELPGDAGPITLIQHWNPEASYGGSSIAQRGAVR